MMQGFGVNTYCLINEKHQRVFVKFHWTPELGVHSLVWDEALKISGQDPDFHRKDLYSAIDNGAYPKWKFGVQVLKESEVDKFDFDILDATKVWPEELVPVRYIGEIELNRNVDEYFPETEQVAFCTSNIVRGIDFSDDPLLQGRNFSYLDTQLNRVFPSEKIKLIVVWWIFQLQRSPNQSSHVSGNEQPTRRFHEIRDQQV
jgi:catalase